MPAGNPDGGQWTRDDGGAASTASGVVLSDAAPENNWIPGAQYAANDPPGGAQNGSQPFGPPPEVPDEEPVTKQAIHAFVWSAALWLAGTTLEATLGGPVGDFVLALEAAQWLYQYLPLIYSYLDEPKTLEELQQDALNPQPGYNIHHIVEQTSAVQVGFSSDMINDPDNLVRIPTLKHWLINGWYSTNNPEFGGLSPRDYLRGKSWNERVRVGKDALTQFGVLVP